MRSMIAMSGGVDSSVAAFLMQQQGYDCIGAMMKLYELSGCDLSGRGRGCCSVEDAEDARSVSARLGMLFYMLNCLEPFHQQIIDRFVDAYQHGSTPNPCIDCNRFMKFDFLLERARALGMDCIATGHYARVDVDDITGRYLLKKGLDENKDQSYVLYTMTQQQLAMTRFPVGELHKEQVRQIAQEQGFLNAKKRDSQDLCFVPDGDYAAFLERHTGKKEEPGQFVDRNGKVLGQHRGISAYTVGQRRGLGLAMPYPVYVCEIIPEENVVVVGAEEELYRSELIARDLNLISVESIQQPMHWKAKIRYRHREQPVTVEQLDADTLHLVFDAPQRAITKGQAVVLYDGELVVGGGTIT